MILLIGISNIIVIYIGGRQIISGEIENIDVLVEFILYVNMLTWPVAAIGWVTSLVQQAEASQERINEFLETRPMCFFLISSRFAIFFSEETVSRINGRPS